MSNSLNIHVCLLELPLFCLFLPFRTQKIVISTLLNLRRRERLQKIWRKLDYSWSLVFTRRDEDVIGIHKLLCASVHNWTMLHGVTVNIHLNVSYFLVYFWLFILHFVIDTWFFFHVTERSVSLYHQYQHGRTFSHHTMYRSLIVLFTQIL